MGLFAFGAQEITARLLLPDSKPGLWLDQAFKALMVSKKKGHAGPKGTSEESRRHQVAQAQMGGQIWGSMRQCIRMTLAPNPVNLAQ